MYILHVNEALNQEVQADFTIYHILHKKHTILNLLDVGPSYGERAIESSRCTESINKMFEIECMYHHGAPESFSDDPEFCTEEFEKNPEGSLNHTTRMTCQIIAKNGRLERKKTAI